MDNFFIYHVEHVLGLDQAISYFAVAITRRTLYSIDAPIYIMYNNTMPTDKIGRKKKSLNNDSTMILLLPSRLHEQVKSHAKAKNISVAELVRTILCDALKIKPPRKQSKSMPASSTL